MTDATLRDYLLGTLSEGEAQQLEERVLDDDELFLTLRGVEDDLVDAFARGELDGTERQAFVKRYGGQRSRVTFARALARRATNVVPFARRRWITYAAAAAIILIAGVVVMRRFEQRPAITSLPVAKIRAATVIVYPVAVTLTTSRSASAANTITLPGDATTLQLRVRLDPADRFDRYRAELQSSRAVIWRAENLKSTSEGDDLFLIADVPESSLPNGSYELAVHGNGEDLGFVTLEVRR